MAVHIVIEFYRTRGRDDAHAVIGRETAEVADLEDAMKVARRLSETLNMPQRPDAMAITDVSGAMLYAGAIEHHASNEDGRS
jgi:hypothetical protein